MEMLEKYYEHIHSELTLLAPIVGLYKLTTKQGRPISIVVMRNVFYTTREMHILYDLKGSSVGRSTLEKGSCQTQNLVLF
jgi:1-phosphatidylinositol-4-phosphate 5-kinase